MNNEHAASGDKRPSTLPQIFNVGGVTEDGIRWDGWLDPNSGTENAIPEQPTE